MVEDRLISKNELMNICFYISDYGYGHASRDIAIIRKILREWKGVKIYIKNQGASDFIKQSLPQKNVEVTRSRNDIGVIFRENSVIMDMERTQRLLYHWINKWNDYISSEKQFCKTHGIDLILSDITPQVFIAADEMGIPAIAISNFTWHYIFRNLFGNMPAIEHIKNAYQHADLAIVLPFNEDMALFREKKEVGLISREITRNKYDMRRKVGISDNELLVYIGVGRSFNPSYMRLMKKIELLDVKLLVPSNVNLPFDNVIKIPETETETQNYINMCDMVVSKTGYSTASEAIRAEIPMFLLRRDGFKEDELIGNTIEKLGVGRFISERAFLEGEWKQELRYLNKYNKKFNSLDGRFKIDGLSEIISVIKEVMS